MKKIFILTVVFLAMLLGTKAQVYLLQESFDTGSLPTGWTTVDADGDGYNWDPTYLYNQSPSYAHTGVGMIASASYNSSVGGLNPSNWLITPAVNLTSNSTLTFWVCAQDASYPGEHYGVYISTSGTATTDFTLLFEETLDANSGAKTQSPWKQKTIDLSSYTGQVVYIAFRHFNCYDMFWLDLDDVEITTLPTYPFITVNSHHMHINAMVGGTGEANNTVNGFNLTSGITATTSAPFAVSDDGTNFSSSVTLPTNGGPLYVQYAPMATGADTGMLILSSPGAADDTVMLTGVALLAATLPYSQTFESSDENNQWLFLHNGTNQWFIGSGANNTDNGQNALYVSNDNGVSNTYDNTSTSTSWAYRDIDFAQYNEYQLAFDFRGVGESSSYDYLKIYLGAPADVPTDASAPLGASLLGTLVNVSSWTHYTATLPASFNGLQRLYLLWWNDSSGGSNPPAALDNITIVGSNCARPNSLTVSNVTAHTADFTFIPAQAGDAAWEYVICTGTQMPDDTTSVSITDTAFNLTNLDANTDYRVYVRTDCGSEYSIWSNVASFTTPPTCTSPTDLTVSNIAGTSALVTWNDASVGATGYTFAYAEVGTENWITIEPTGNQVLLSGLNPLTTYQVSVSSNCDEGTAPAAVQIFTTKCLSGGDLQIGEGTGTNSNLPAYSLYNYSYTQQIFLASELSNVSEIHSISFQISSLYTPNRHIAIYLMHTSSASSDWLNATNAQLMYNGNVTLVEDWNTFSFASPFLYNGTDNLAVIVIDSTGSWSSSNSWTTHTTPTELSHYVYQDDAPYGVDAIPSSGYTTTSRNNVIFGTPCDSTDVPCSAPNMFVESIGSDEVTISWVPGYQETSWELQYKAVNDTVWTVVGTITTSPYTLDNLNPNTSYDIRLGTDCDTTYAWAVSSVHTNCVAFGIPFYEDFDSYTASSATRPDCWSFPITYSSAPYITSTNYSAPNSLFFQSATTTPTTAVSPAIDADIQTLRVKFMLRAESTTSSGTFEVGVMSDPNNVGTFESVAIIQPTNTSWNQYVYDLNNVTMTGSGRYIAFRQHSNSSVYYYWLDNVNVIPIPACQEPTGLATVNTTTTTAELTWVSQDNDFNLYYRAVSDTTWSVENNVTLTNNVYTLSGLTHSTTYVWKVGNNCNDGSVSMSDQASFSTMMEASTLPYSTDFNAGSDVSWLLHNGNCANYWTIGAADTANALFVTNNGTTPGYSISSISVVSAEKLFTVGDAAEFNISFDVTIGGESSWDYLKVFLAPANVEFPAATSTPEYATYSYSTNAMDFSDYLSSTGYTSYPYKLNLTNGLLHVDAIMPNPNTTPNANSNAKLVFLWKNDSSGGDQPGAIIYNVSVSAVTCSKPSNLTVTNITENSVDVSWTAGAAESAWNLEYKQSNASNWTVVPVTTPSYQITGLTAETGYDVRVQADCGSGDVSIYLSGNFTTAAGQTVTNPTVTTAPASVTSATSATLNATITNPDNVTISAKGFEWKTTTGGTYVPVAGTGSGNTFTATLSTLTPNTGYTYKAFITYNGTTVYGDEVTFTTPDVQQTCPAPTNLTYALGDPSHTTVTLTWQQEPNTANEWQVNYRQTTESTWSTATATSTSYTLTDLVPNVDYEANVVAHCTNGLTSDASNTVTWHTDDVGIQNYLDKAVNLYPNPATEMISVAVSDANIMITGVEVYNVYGQLINTIVSTENPLRINISGLAEGMYYVRVTTDNGVVTKNFVKR